jgi:hypothetical protein
MTLLLRLCGTKTVFEHDELDARNSDNRPETYEAVVARLYNDPDLDFYTESLPGLHDSFARPICLDYTLMPGGDISAEDVKKKVGDARAKLMQVSSTAARRKVIVCQWLKQMSANMYKIQ